MTRRIGNGVIYLFFIAILWASIQIPDMLLERLSFSFGASVYDGRGQGGIDVEAEEIYLVKVIHDMETEGTTVYYTLVSKNPLAEYEIEAAPEELEQVEEEMKKLKECKVLKDFDPIVGTGAEILTEIYVTDRMEYKVKNTFIDPGNTVWLLEQEERTGKVLSVFFNEEDMPKESERRELLENYIRYLDLYIIDDWSYEDQRMRSKKAELVVGFEKGGEGCTLSIHSGDAFFDEQQYMETNEYKYSLYMYKK